MRNGDNSNHVGFDEVHEEVWIRRKNVSPRAGEIPWPLRRSVDNLLNGMIELTKKPCLRGFAAVDTTRDLLRSRLPRPRKSRDALPVNTVQMSTNLRPWNGLHSPRPVVGHASFDFRCPSFLDTFVGRIFDALKQHPCELRAILRRQLRSLFVQLFHRACHDRILPRRRLPAERTRASPIAAEGGERSVDPAFRPGTRASHQSARETGDRTAHRREPSSAARFAGSHPIHRPTRPEGRVYRSCAASGSTGRCKPRGARP